MGEPDRSLLHGRWTHSHEEDSDGETVYRPADWDFPPSRGRRSFELHADGALASSKPGPTDQAVGATGEWRLLPDCILELDHGGDVSRLHLVEVKPDKLVIRK